MQYAGPPLTPHPVFHVVNAMHIKVEWDKPFVCPEFDIRNYTLHTSSGRNRTTTTDTLYASSDTNYSESMIHYISNGGVIPQECIYMNFTLIATNDVGSSTEGFATGGFAIGMLPLCHFMQKKYHDYNILYHGCNILTNQIAA